MVPAARHGHSIGRLIVLAIMVTVGVMGNSYWLFVLQMSFIMGIVALGTMVVAGYAREITLMQASLTGTAIYLSGWAYRNNYDGLRWPFPLAVALGTGVVVAISVLVAVASARLLPIYVMVLTLGVQFTIENSIFTVGKLTGGLQAPLVPRPNFYGISLRNEHNEFLFLMAISVVLIVLVERFRNCKYGRAVLAVGNDQQAAAAMGINPWRYRVLAFAIGGLFAGLGGSLWAPQLGAPPGVMQFFAMQSLFFLAIPVFAGFESVPVVFVTGMFFMALPMALEQFQFQPLLLGGLALLAGVFMGPRGITGFVHDKVGKIRRVFAADGLAGLLKMIVRPSRPTWMRMPDRELRRAYKVLRAEEPTATCWTKDSHSTAVT